MFGKKTKIEGSRIELGFLLFIYDHPDASCVAKFVLKLSKLEQHLLPLGVCLRGAN